MNPVYYNRPHNILDTEILFQFINVELALLLPPPHSLPIGRGMGSYLGYQYRNTNISNPPDSFMELQISSLASNANI